MQPDLFPDAPRGPGTPATASVDAQILRYAAGRTRGITLHGVMRDLNIVHATALQTLGELLRTGAIQATGKRRQGCRVYSLPKL